MRDTTQQNNVLEKLRLHASDTGSPQVQVARLTARIQELSEHLKIHRKDFHSRHGLLKMVSLRRRLLEYLRQHHEDAYRAVLDALNLRK